MKPRWKGEVGWNLVEWTECAYGSGRTANESDRGTDLSEAYATGSRPVEDHILEHTLPRAGRFIADEFHKVRSGGRRAGL